MLANIAALATRPALTWWLTGLPAAGKSTLAQALAEALRAAAVPVCVLDGDVVRAGLSADLGFSTADRAENVRRVAAMATLMADAGICVVVALVSPVAAERARARATVGAARFVEVHVATPLAVCEQRDPKQLYKKARLGQIASFTGVSDPYELSPHYDLVIDTSVTDVAAATAALLRCYQ